MYRAINFRYALALFRLIFASKSDLGSCRSLRFVEGCVVRVQYGWPSQAQVLALLVRLHHFWARDCLLTRCTASPLHTCIKVSGLPKTALPQDVRRLAQTRKLENISGSESVNLCSYPVTLPIPFHSSIHGLRSLSANRSRLLDTIVFQFHGSQLANAEKGHSSTAFTSRHGRSESFPCCKDEGFNRTPGSC